MAKPSLLDPMWGWLRTALERLYGELDPEADDVSLTLCARYADGQLVAYVLTPELAEIACHVVTDQQAILQGFNDGAVRTPPV
jgi:hypothetical protein